MTHIERLLWNNLANIVQDMGRVHPSYASTSTGADLAVLGAAIRYSVDDGESSQLRAQAEAVIAKHGYQLHATTLCGRCIETANRLLGLPTSSNRGNRYDAH